ncbi:MAG TPA: HEAT repeat domain-containing protein, partial [Demequina sp.]|nr:HEAT repeat domain-containing protein [Demequina sp.]
MDHDAAPTRRALAAVRTAPTILEAIRRADDLIDVAAREASPGEVVRLLREALVDASDASDALTAIAAVHALAAVRDSGGAAETLVGLLSDGTPNLREHAAWALGSSPAAPRAIPELEAMVSGGGFGGTLAQLTLEAWGVGGDETLGLVPGGTTTAASSTQ